MYYIRLEITTDNVFILCIFYILCFSQANSKHISLLWYYITSDVYVQLRTITFQDMSVSVTLVSPRIKHYYYYYYYHQHHHHHHHHYILWRSSIPFCSFLQTIYDDPTVSYHLSRGSSIRNFVHDITTSFCHVIHSIV